ncbi:DUF63 family protein [Halonotius terrestris]|uniref:DUF63 family protein n=1 Tax=Halonotius terrestris TaxID=2487750 RepID=A0A8J8PCN8_9EURY|nr:DUF63 family protein [Halonotius terrestris]TQQ82798.1 DUF63 family protein [Halonotius terrestris]
MVLLPAGFGPPPLPYLVVLVIAAVGVGYGLLRRRPSVGARHIVGLTPWMAVGSALHVLYAIEGLPSILAPFAGTGAVYLTTAVIVGAVWLVADRLDPTTVPAALAATGLAVLVPAGGFALYLGMTRGTLAPYWPAVGAVATIAVTAAAWLTLRWLRPAATAATGRVGLVAVFGHTLDAVSTTVGVDVLGFGERTPLSRVILEAAAALPTADAIGTGWLFVLVKLGVVGGVIVLFRDYVEDEPTEGYLLLGLIAAVGLGPGFHNLLLFTVTAGGL